MHQRFTFRSENRMHSLVLAAQHFRLSRFNLLRLSMAAIGDLSQSISCRGPIAQHLFFILEQKKSRRSVQRGFSLPVAWIAPSHLTLSGRPVACVPFACVPVSCIKDMFSGGNSRTVAGPAARLAARFVHWPGSSGRPAFCRSAGNCCSKLGPAEGGAVRATNQNFSPGCGADSSTPVCGAVVAAACSATITGALSAGTATELTGCGTTLCIVGETTGCDNIRAETSWCAVRWITLSDVTVPPAAN